MEPAPAPELADTSVWARSGKPGLEWFAPAIEEGRIAVCDQVAMELLWSARDVTDFRATEAGLLACPWFEVEPADWAEARRVFRELASRGPLHHRQVKIPDLLIAAVAARHRLTIVHYDHDYDIIASITGQTTRWAAPRGSIV
ncbi:MAG TPA: PIN domain-containing protein [Candidatus Limnocylindrales bacterium]|nr:PIN domain-containing protein [Candidatus Limnocylindrales bacterium]